MPWDAFLLSPSSLRVELNGCENDPAQGGFTVINKTGASGTRFIFPDITA